jgi:hypothetical protein
MAFNVIVPINTQEPRFETDADGFRVFPEHEDSKARIAFELYGHGEQERLIGMGMSTASGALAGSSAGPVGILVGGLLGTIAGYWKVKTYRSQRYAAYAEAGGIVERRRAGRRSLFYRDPDEHGWRYPYGDLVADVVVDVLSKRSPEMSIVQLRDVGAQSLRVFKAFRMAHPDIPLELAADTILAHYGIVAKPDAENGYVYDPHAAHTVIHPTVPPPDVAEREGANWLIYAAAAAVVLVALK